MHTGNATSISQMLMQLQGATSTQSLNGGSGLFRQQVAANTAENTPTGNNQHTCTGATLSTTTITVVMQFSGTSSCGTSTAANEPDGDALTALFMKRLKEAFTAADENGDGKLDKTEFAKFLKNLTGSQLTPDAQVNGLFTKLDNDGDGNITMNEVTGHFDELRDLTDPSSLAGADGSSAISQTINALGHLMQQMHNAYAQSGATSMAFFASISTAA